MKAQTLLQDDVVNKRVLQLINTTNIEQKHNIIYLFLYFPGKPVYILESDDDVLTRCVISVRAIIDRMLKRGEISEEKCRSMQTNLIPCRHYERLKVGFLFILRT